MVNLSDIFQIWRSRSGHDVRQSVGEKLGVVQKGKRICWEAIGTVRETWITFAPKLMREVNDQFDLQPVAVFIELYMMGRSIEKARPTIMVFSPDAELRQSIRRFIKASHVMENYPEFYLGDAPGRPIHIAHGVSNTPTPAPVTGGGQDVYTVPSAYAFGRKVIMRTSDGHPRKVATGGPILFINDRVHQLTAGHTFWPFEEDIDPSDLGASNVDEWDVEDESESEESSESVVAMINGTDRDLASNASRNAHDAGEPQRDESKHHFNILETDSLKDLTSDHLNRKDELSEWHGGEERTHQASRREFVRDRSLRCLGRLSLLPAEEDETCLDYALVELDPSYCHDRNEVAFGPYSTQTTLIVTQPATVGTKNIKVAAMTASSGYINGELTATPSFMRRPNTRVFQAVYRVTLDGTLAAGDSGSGVIDRHLGHFHGHIVMGTIHTGLAYIIPAMDILDDISRRLMTTDISFVPAKRVFTGDPTSLDPDFGESRRKVEVGSKMFFTELKPTHGEEQSAATLPTEEQNLNAAAGLRPWESSAKSALLQELLFDHGGNNRKRETSWISKKLSRRVRRNTQQTTVNDGDFNRDMPVYRIRILDLPGDLLVHIISLLPVPDILKLRLLSKNFYEVMRNEGHIARAFLSHGHIPSLALRLYPPPQPSHIDLHYLTIMWQRLSVSSQLCQRITSWATTEMFLRKTDHDLLEFSRQRDLMLWRLFPLVLTIFHFLETVNSIATSRIGQRAKFPNPLISAQRDVIQTYDNDLLLEVHQVFPLLISYFQRSMRPPSFYSRPEKTLRGFGSQPASDELLASILWISGLRGVLRLVKIKQYHERIKVARDWYNSLSLTKADENQMLSYPAIQEIQTIPQTLVMRPSKAVRDYVIPLHRAWIPVAEELILQRGIVDKPQSIKKDSQVLLELVRERLGPLDELLLTGRLQ